MLLPLQVLLLSSLARWEALCPSTINGEALDTLIVARPTAGKKLMKPASLLTSNLLLRKNLESKRLDKKI